MGFSIKTHQGRIARGRRGGMVFAEFQFCKVESLVETVAQRERS